MLFSLSLFRIATSVVLLSVLPEGMFKLSLSLASKPTDIWDSEMRSAGLGFARKIDTVAFSQQRARSSHATTGGVEATTTPPGKWVNVDVGKRPREPKFRGKHCSTMPEATSSSGALG